MTEKGKALYMAMEITNNYRNHAINYADFAKKSDFKEITELKTNNKDKYRNITRNYAKNFLR